jgi:hypothetical protein
MNCRCKYEMTFSQAQAGRCDMRILSIRRAFDGDHSSSSYEFFAFDRLTAEQRAAVRALTGGSARRHLRFHYQGDWSDIPSDWPDKLLTMGYDVLVSESYDWWAVHLSLPHGSALAERLGPYQCEADGNGLDVRVIGERMIVYFGMQMDYGALYDAFGEDTFEGLSDLFEAVRAELLSGDISAAWAMYQTYGHDEEGGPEPVKPLSPSARTLLDIMESY